MLSNKNEASMFIKATKTKICDVFFFFELKIFNGFPTSPHFFLWKSLGGYRFFFWGGGGNFLKGIPLKNLVKGIPLENYHVGFFLGGGCKSHPPPPKPNTPPPSILGRELSKIWDFDPKFCPKFFQISSSPPKSLKNSHPPPPLTTPPPPSILSGEQKKHHFPKNFDIKTTIWVKTKLTKNLYKTSFF